MIIVLIINMILFYKNKMTPDYINIMPIEIRAMEGDK